METRKILVGIDFGPVTDIVLQYASFFAKALGASLNLLYVIDYLITPPSYLTPYMENEKKIAIKNFALLKKQLTDAGIKAESDVIVGRLHESFVTIIEKKKSDMLILGFNPHAFRRSSAEKLIKGLKMPMLVVRGEKSVASRKVKVNVERILCPVDFSEMSEKALKIAKELRGIFSSKLDILHIYPSYLIKKKLKKKEYEKLVEKSIKQEENRFNTFLRKSFIDGSGIIDEGEPDKKIVSFAKENDTDLIVIGARGLGLIKGMIIGSVTDAILKTSPCPVLVIH
jgi:nucleotide-binding universal stress UspA family protein